MGQEGRWSATRPRAVIVYCAGDEIRDVGAWIEKIKTVAGNLGHDVRTRLEWRCVLIIPLVLQQMVSGSAHAAGAGAGLPIATGTMAASQ